MWFQSKGSMEMEDGIYAGLHQLWGEEGIRACFQINEFTS